MALNKVVISHLEEQDVLEEAIEQDIESLISKLSISELMAGAEEALLGVVGNLQLMLKDNYYPESSKNGIEFARNIEKDKEIEVTDSNDPNLNEGVVDDKRES